MKKKELLGQLLVEKGLISPSQLTEGLNDQKSWGGKIGLVLVRMGAISSSQLLDVLSEQFGVAKIDFSRSPITLEALEMVPKTVCEKYGLVPVAKKDLGSQKRLLVAMANPMNYDAIREVEFSGQCIVSTVLAIEDDIRRAIDYCYSDQGLRECLSGIPSVSGIELDSVNLEDSEDAVIFTQEGKEVYMVDDFRGTGLALKVLIDLLAEKGIIDIIEFQDKLKKTKDEN